MTVGILADDDDDVLSYTQRKRMELVEHLTANDKMPVEAKDQAVLLSALNDMDRQVVSKRKMKTEEKNSDSLASMADTMDHLFTKFGNKSPMMIEGGVAERTMDIPDKLVEIELVPGELDIGSQRIELRDIEDNAA